MKDHQKTLLLGILIIIILCIYYNKTTESFDSRVPDCHNPQFNKEVDGNIIKHCAEIDGIGHGCQESDISVEGTDPRLSAFSIFGSYIDNLDSRDVNSCLQRPNTSQTLSDWGLCQKDTINKIRGFGYKQNEELLNAIQLACNFYEKANTPAKIQ